MLQNDLNLLVELNFTRQLPIDDEWSLKESLNNENLYLDLVQGYASNEAFLKESINLVQAKDSFDDIKLEVCHIIFNSADNDLILELLEFACSDAINISIDEKLSLLGEKTQKSIIKSLLRVNNKKSMSYAGKCILSNGYQEFVSPYYNDKGIISTHDPSVAYAVLCRLGNTEEISLVKATFEESNHPILKEYMALELVFAEYEPALKYIKEQNSIHSFQLSPFIYLKNDSCLYEKKLVGEVEKLNADDTDNFMNYFSQAMIWYGNPMLIPFFTKMLKERSISIQLHEILLRFFDEDDPNMRDAYTIIDKWNDCDEKLEDGFADYEGDDYEEKYAAQFDQEALKTQKEIIAFWNKKKSYLKQIIDTNQKYYTYKPFSIPEIWNNTFNEGLKEQITLAHKGVQLLTGKYFVFDSNALLSKQLQQRQTIMDFFHPNKDQYIAGKWYLWGKQKK